MTSTQITPPATPMSRQGGWLRVPVHAVDHALGAADAAVTLVEYGDYQCPHCARAHPVVQEIRGRLGDRLRFVFRNFPLTEIHPNALHAAEAAESVAAHAGEEAFWRMHHAIFAHQRDSRTALHDSHLAQYAAEAGAEGDAVLRDLDAGTHEERVRAEFMGGIRSGVNGTPTFFVNGRRFDGDWMDGRALEQALAQAAGADFR
jgi:protein-disulfide isomerase